MSEVSNKTQPTTAKDIAHTKDAAMTQEVVKKQTEYMDNSKMLSPDFSNLTTDVRDNPNIGRPHPSNVQLFPQNSRPTVVGYNPRKTAMYNLRPNPKPYANPDFRQ